MTKKNLPQLLDLSWTLGLASCRSRYRNTWAGFLWVLLSPLLQMVVQGFVFSEVIRIPIDRFNLFFVTGILPWIFIQQALVMTTPTLVSHERLLLSFKLHPLILIGASLVDHVLNFLILAFLLILPLSLWEGCPWWSFLLFLGTLMLVLFSLLALCFFLSLLHVHFRDTNFVLSFLLGIAFFATPLFYPLEMVPERWRFLIELNPIHHLIHPLRMSFLDHAQWPMAFMKLIVVAFVLNFLTYTYWKKKRDQYVMAF
jgi:lipopolysaccharide transport system permease protein